MCVLIFGLVEWLNAWRYVYATNLPGKEEQLNNVSVSIDEKQGRLGHNDGKLLWCRETCLTI